MNKQRRRDNLVVLVSIVLFIFSAIIAFYSIIVSTGRSLTALENSFLWLFGLVASITASFLITKQSTQKAALEIIKPHAKSAFRRLLSLYRSLSRVSNFIQETRENNVIDDNNLVLIIEAKITELIDTAGDALEDWRDIIPEQIEEVERRIRERRV